MPHFTTFDNFASKAIVHPQFQEGSKAIVHPQFQEAAKAIVHPQFQPEAGRAIVHPQFQPEADGFMKLGDIKGEFSPSREDSGIFAGPIRLIGQASAEDWGGQGEKWLRANPEADGYQGPGNDAHPRYQPEAGGISNQQVQLRNGIRDVDVGAEMLLPGTANRALGGTAGPGGSTFSTGGGGDSLTDAGLGNNSFHQGADVLTNVSYTTDRNGVWDDPTTWSGASASVISEACTPTCPTGFAEDALVQQVNGTIGYEMQAGMGISANARGKTTGTIAAYNVMGSGVPVESHCTGYCFEGGSPDQENIFAPGNVLRSDNHF